jgi:hypothetical protein
MEVENEIWNTFHNFHSFKIFMNFELFQRFRVKVTFSSGTSQGPTVNIFTLMVGAPEPSAPAPPEGLPLTFSRGWWALPDPQP